MNERLGEISSGFLKEKCRVRVSSDKGPTWVTLYNETGVDKLFRGRPTVGDFMLRENALVYRINFWIAHKGDVVSSYTMNFRRNRRDSVDKKAVQLPLGV